MGSNPTLSAKILLILLIVFIKKSKNLSLFKNLKGKTLIEILYKIGFRIQEKGLRIFYLKNRKKINKIGVCVAKKKIRSSIERNLLKRRIKTAYKAYSKNIVSLQKDLIIYFFWKKKYIPSFRRLNPLMRKILSLI